MKKITNEELNRPTEEEFKKIKKIPLIIVLDSVRSLNNIGAIFRTADAFTVEKIILCGICATPPNREIHKTALGAELTVNWEYKSDSVEAVKDLVSEGVDVYAVEQVHGSIMLDNFTPQKEKGYAIVLGNEVDGVKQEVVDICTGAIEIPQTGTKHSLNVSVACGVVVWAFYEKLVTK